MSVVRHLGVAHAVTGGRVVDGDVAVEDGRVVAVGLAGPGSGVALPGFVDLQVNGFAGVDLLGAGIDGYRELGERLARTGVTAYQPTFISSPEDDLLGALRVAARALREPAAGAEILGVHLEGPFLSPARAGAHPPAALREPDPALAERLVDAHPVSCMTLAPELPGALELIEMLRARGVTVSCGHSDATAAQAHAAFDLGVRTVTHLFNAMAPLAHREPGLAGAALARSDVVVQAIADGVHLADEVLLLAWRAAGGRLALVSDQIAAAAMGDGPARLGGVAVEVRDGVARRSDGTLAGGTATMLDGLRRLCRLGVPLEAAAAAASAVPARVLGREDIGVLRVGAGADIVVLDDSLEIRQVLVRGRPAL